MPKRTATKPKKVRLGLQFAYWEKGYLEVVAIMISLLLDLKSWWCGRSRHSIGGKGKGDIDLRDEIRKAPNRLSLKTFFLWCDSASRIERFGQNVMGEALSCIEFGEWADIVLCS